MAKDLLFAAGSFGPAIANHLWQSTAFAAAVWMLTLLLRNNDARIRYALWLAASLKFLLPFSLLVALGGFLPSPRATAIHAQPALYSAVNVAAQPFSQGALRVSEQSATLQDRWIAQLPSALAACWLCGFAAVLVVWCRRWRQVSAVLRKAVPVEGGRELEILRGLERRANVPMIPLLQSWELMEPGVFGIFRPALLWPARLSDQLDDEHIAAILAHETMHVRRHDNLTAALHMLVEALFWFHPLVWWMERRLIQERERACDEAVVALGNRPEAYAESLLKACRFCVESPLTCVSGITGADLSKRVRSIMTLRLEKLSRAKKVLLGMAGLAAVVVPVTFGLVHATQTHAQSAPANPARNIVASWQGILHTDRDLRIVVKITKSSDGTLRTTFYNLDGEPGGIPAISTTLHGSLLKIELPFATYEGTLSDDGNSITGTWRQGPNPPPLNFARATTETAWTIPQPPSQIPPMAADANPTFEVATIKPTGPDEHGPRYDFQTRRFSVIHASLSDLLKFSYGLQQSQIAKAQDWVNSESYDISAEPDGEGEPSIKQWQSMVAKLMADRFQLKFHYEKREQTVYVLSVVKTGPRLTRSQSDANAPGGMGFGPAGHFGATNATMADIASALGQGVLNRPVVDQTGLTGKFDLGLTWTPDGPPLATESADAPPGLFTAIQEQLGLKLVSTKAPVDVLVIDHIERPSPN